MDRNIVDTPSALEDGMSPSSRRAWIEISVAFVFLYALTGVALLAEGVDRNLRMSRIDTR